MSTLRQLLSWGSETLEKAEVPDSGQDAWMLMEEVFGIEKSYYFLHGTDKIDPDVQKRYEEMIRDRAKRIPVQYLTLFPSNILFAFHTEEPAHWLSGVSYLSTYFYML